MHRDTFSRLRFAAPAVLAGLLGWSSVASAQTKPVPDAQVEANVLKALASAPDLANQAITTTTVYGVVTLSGTVESEALRTEADMIASKSSGVQKVVDEMALSGNGATPASAQNPGASAEDQQGTNPTLQSDGTMAPAQQGPAPITQGTPNAPAQGTANPGGGAGPGAPEYRQPYPGQYGRPGNDRPAAHNGPPPYGPNNGPTRYDGGRRQPYPESVFGGQEAGEMVTVPSGAMVRIRINQSLDSGRAKPGEHFDGIVVNDVVAGGAVAIPRGAAIEGTVVDAHSSGALAGRGELSLQLTQMTLGGKSYPVVSDLWSHHGGDKTIETVNKTAIGGGIGALFGAAAARGTGAAVGAGIGAALGLGSSAASDRGQVYVPSEGMLTFHLAQPATVATLSQLEMDRLAQGVGPSGQPPQLQRRNYPRPYYGPVYYLAYPPYAPYPYSRYPY